MKNGRNTEKRKWSAGTILMLVMLITVTGGSVLVLGRLSSGAHVDLSRLNMNVLDIREDPAREAAGGDEETPAAKQKAEKNTAAPAQETEAPKQKAASFTLTMGGSLSLSGEVRKNSKGTDSGKPDYADIMMLLAPQVRSDVNGLFLENIVSDRYKASDTVAPESATGLLKEAGFGMAACGFAQAYANGREGVEATLTTLSLQGINAVGIRSAAEADDFELKTVNGIRTAFLQYTANVPARTRKNMEKEGTDGMVPEADAGLISREIGEARDRGAEAVIVMVCWGKTGKDPDRSQRELAEAIAQAGADLIIGNGSHVPQAAEYLQGAEGKSVLCVWSLGTLLCGDRANTKRVSGYLLHVTVQGDGRGGVQVMNPEYTPVYAWKYRQDGRYYYRCIASNGTAPDGMDSEQRKTMKKSAETVEKVLQDSPLAARGQ